MVAHGIAQILQRQQFVGDDPKGHLLGILLDTGGVWHILGEIVGKAIEEAPHAGLAVAATGEVGLGIGGIIAEVGILTLEPAHGARIADDIVGADHQTLGLSLLETTLSLGHGLGIQQILHADLHVAAVEELRDAALVSVGGDGIVGDADGYPDGAPSLLRAVRAAAHHLEHPGLVLVGHREGLTLGTIAILGNERCHHLQGFAGRL